MGYLDQMEPAVSLLRSTSTPLPTSWSWFWVSSPNLFTSTALLRRDTLSESTTLGILTGDISPTGGDAYVAGQDISGRTPGGVAKARQSIGFCPQTDPYVLFFVLCISTLRLSVSLDLCLYLVVAYLI